MSHIAMEDFEELLFGRIDEQDQIEFGRHLLNCQACHSKFESLVADNEFWLKAAEFLVDAPGSSDNPKYGAGGFFQNQAVAATQQLKPPRHPEMLGSIGHYEVEQEIGRGGMGIVYKGYDSKLRRVVAIKVLSPNLAAFASANHRFMAEARAAASILHPNVVQVHSVGICEKTPFFVMPLISGESVQQLIDRTGPLSEHKAVSIAMQTAAGLSAAHSQGVIHRDVKPGNILIESGTDRAFVTDFGLALAANDAGLTQSGQLLGTPNFMSPEQIEGIALDSRSDLFSLGSLIYFMTTGCMPFRADSAFGVMHRIRHKTPTPIRSINVNISQTLSDLVQLLMAKDPGSRIEDADSVHKILKQQLLALRQPDQFKSPLLPKRRREKSSIQNLKYFVSIASLVLVGVFFVTGILRIAMSENPKSAFVFLDESELAENSNSVIPLKIDADANSLVLTGLLRLEFGRAVDRGELVLTGETDKSFVARIRIEKPMRDFEIYLPPGSYNLTLKNSTRPWKDCRFDIVRGDITGLQLD